ncbi:response regulator transcription factor [Paenibacillus sp. Y412MC10]|uniref:response regulator transcription factor n=1 Tax=Geobacillus sp. (strain Y412MC10) TaxID=481743 RepID=UPI0001787D17|nr:response regulator transcription factor [Paenibacillus sp. Y412MC10]ACX65117.1 two component transcriptional regulator, winged helix family [Paenibacillus sp. Y412MC10]
MPRTILVVDDDPDIVDMLKLYLDAEGYTTLAAFDGLAALEHLRSQRVDLALFDIMMPVIDGYQLLRTIRQDYKIPVILVSAKNQELDKITGLKLGADDYVSKPFSPMEVMARIQAQLRRSYEFNESSEPDPVSVTRIGDLVLDHREYMLYINGKPISLSAIEYKLLNLFMGEPGRVFTKRQMFEHAWDELYLADDNAVMVQISRLRDKIETNPRNPVYIKTIRGLGYRFAKKDELNA